MYQGSWAGTAAFHIEVGWQYTVAVSAGCSVHQLSGCEYAVNVLYTPLG